MIPLPAKKPSGLFEQLKCHSEFEWSDQLLNKRLDFKCTFCAQIEADCLAIIVIFDTYQMQ